MKRYPFKGQSLVEYGLILALATVVVIAALQVFGKNLGAVMDKSSGSIQKAKDYMDANSP